MYPNPHPHRRFALECVSTCVGYGDFLNVTLPLNLPHFDRYVIVTTPDDHETREVCRRYGVKCLLSRECYRDGHAFCKGRLINIGLEHLHHTSWLLHLDADMVLPLKTRELMQHADLDPRVLYGCDRVMVKGYAEWLRLRYSGWLAHDYHCRVAFPEGYTVGSRWASELHGYCPIGAFQLWHTEADYDERHPGVHVRPYPTEHHDAARGDIQFAIQWDRRERALLPELIAVHLESGPCKMGANWKGRTTKRFEPNGK